MPGHFLSSRALYAVARKAYERTAGAPSDLAPGQNDALVAILFSAAVLEAFINELTLHAETGANSFSRPKYLADLHYILKEAERSRASLELKYLLAKTILPGERYDKGAQPFQDFALLIKLRNALVHLRPERVDEDPHRLVAALESRGLCEKSPPNVKSSLFARVTTRAVARWAYNTVAAMVLSVRDGLPVDDSAHPASWIHTGYWRSGFEPVE